MLKVSVAAFKLNSCILLGTTLLLLQSDTGNKLGCMVSCAGGRNSVVREEYYVCMAGGDSVMLSEAIENVTVLVNTLMVWNY